MSESLYPSNARCKWCGCSPENCHCSPRANAYIEQLEAAVLHAETQHMLARYGNDDHLKALLDKQKKLEGAANRLVAEHDDGLTVDELRACRCLQCKHGLRELRAALAVEEAELEEQHPTRDFPDGGPK